MSLSENLLEIWGQSQYQPPEIPLLFYDGDLMVVISDSGAFIRFMSIDGQVYLALNKNCEVVVSKTEDVYSCYSGYQILCSPSTIQDNRDLFVLNKIIPLLL